MAVIIRKQVKFGNKISEIEAYQPQGVISRDERIKADKLDEYLKKRIPKIAEEVLQELPDKDNTLKKWYLLGKKLRGIVNNRDLVMQSDIDNMLIWQSIWYYLPRSMMPERTNLEKGYIEKQHKRQDHLSICYELGQFQWEEVNWIERWSDWHEITARRAIISDKRIFKSLALAIKSLKQYPSKEKMIDILKVIKEKYPTQQFRDTSIFDEVAIEQFVSSTVENTINE